MHRITKLLIVLVAALAVAVVLDKTGVLRLNTPGGQRELSGPDQARLDSLKSQFWKERNVYVRQLESKTPAAGLAAQEAKVSKLASQIMALGGKEALQAIGKAPELRRGGPGGPRGRMGGGPRGGGRRGPGGAPGASHGQPASKLPAPEKPAGKP